MPIDIGDAVMTFLGDATDLNAAIDQVNVNVNTKLEPAAGAAKKVGDELGNAGKKGKEAGEQISESWLKVARATTENTEAQKKLVDALTLVKKVGGDNVEAMAALAMAQEKAAVASRNLAVATKEATTSGESEVVNMRNRRESAAAFGEMTGVVIPRGLRNWLGEMKLIGPAMEAAFSVLAPLLLLTVLSDGIEKLEEWHEATEKLREEWTASDTQFRTTSNSIREGINQQEEEFIRLTQGPMAAYEFALKHIKSTFDETMGKIGGELDQQGEKFISRGGWFSSLFGGADKANAKEAGKDLKEFSASLQETMKTAQDLHSENPFAGMDAGIKSINEKIGDLNVSIEKEQASLRDAEAYQKLHGGSILGIDVASLERARTILQEAGKILQDSRDRERQARDTETARIKSDEIAHQKDIDTAKLNAHQVFLLASLNVTAENQRIEFERGKESLNKFLQQEKEHEVAKYDIERDGLNQRLDLANKDKVRNEQELITLQGQLEDLRLQHHLRMLQIDQEGYKRQAEQIVKALGNVVASTKDGSEERINAEQAVLDFLEATYGRESDAYLAQQAKVTAAMQAHTELRRNLSKEEAHHTEQMIQDKEAAEVAFASFLRSSSIISAAQLFQIQQQAAEKSYQAKRAALVNELNQLGSQEELARKKVNNSIELLDQQHQAALRLSSAQTSQILETYYQQLGIKSTLVLMRERDLAKEAYEAIAKSGTASYGQILQAQIKVLQATIALNAAEGKNVSKDEAAMNKLIAAYNRLQFALGNVSKQGKLAETVLKGLGVNANQMGSVMQNVALGATAALSKMFEAWGQGGITVAKACEQMTAAILQSIAQYAFAKAIEQLALGWADLGDPLTAQYAAAHFTSAALWFVAGGAASIAGGLVSGAASGGGSSSSGSSTSSTPSLTTPGSNSTPPTPVQSVNVQHFATGRLVSKRTLAMIGDSANGGDANEAALPLDDPKAMHTVGTAIANQMPGGAGGGNIIVLVQGLISPDNLTKVIKKIDRHVNRGGGKLTSSNTLRVTKRSV